MISKRTRFLFSVLLLLLVTLFSCVKKSQDIKKKKDNTAENNRLIALGDKYDETEKRDSAYYYYNKAKSICDVKKDSRKIVSMLCNMANIQYMYGDYSGSETTAIEAFPILEKTKNPKYKWNIYIILALNYLETLDYDNSIYYNKKALNLKIDRDREICTKNNIAFVYMEMHDYQRAIVSAP